MSTKSPPPPISSKQYTILSFDLYGTLVDFEGGVYPYLRPLLNSATLPSTHPYRNPFPPSVPTGKSTAQPHPLLATFSSNESRVQASNPTAKFDDVLRECYETIAEETGAVVRGGDVEALIRSSREWPAFPDTVAAMRRLEETGRYKFIALSNNSRVGLKAVLEGPLKGVKFDRAYSAEEIGSYKPDKRNFEHLLKGVEELGGSMENLLHCAHGVNTDQTVCEELGIRHVWVERKVDNWADVAKDTMEGLVVVRDAEDLARHLLEEE